CHEAGVLLLAFTPCLYCDASDAWTLPQRWRRVVVALAGVWFEAWLALAAIGVWFFAEPLWLRTLALDVVIVSLVSSLLVNLNPLLRFDGYYVLADTTGIANLHGESRDALWGPIARWVTASPVAEPSRRPRWLVWYGLASMLFGWGVLVVILWSLHGWLASLGWRAAGDALVAVTAAGLISGGIARVAARTPRGPGGRRGVAALRSVLLLVATGATSAAVLAWPIEQSLRSPCRLEAADSTEIVASIAGELHLVAAYGDRVRAGDVLAELREPAAELRESELAQRVTESELRIKTLRTRAERDATLFSDLASARSELAEAGRQLAAHRAEQERRLIVAPRDGVLTGPPAFNPPASDERHSDLPAWTGRPLDPANAGAHLEAGAVLGAIARGKKLRAVVLLDQADSGLVEVTDRVRIALDRSPGEPLLGRVVRVAPAAADRDRLGRSSLDDARDAELRGALGRADPYRVTVELDTSSVGAQPGAVGAARIVTGRETVGESLLRWLRRLFRLG
ncbi:MAG: HlyD family efflux transporter periplasmic adaptor subunit, partial [Planctomycetota bacterium]